MKNKVSFYHKFSIIFLILSIVTILLTIGSIAINMKSNADYKDCTISTTGTLNSCLSQKNGVGTSYFGVYTFQYNGSSWNFVNPTFYSKEDKVPQTVTLKHNNFKTKEEIKAKVKYDRGFVIPFIYAIISILLICIFFVYHISYKNEKLLADSRRNIIDVDSEIDKAITENEQ